MFFIGQNVKNALMTYSFLELLILFLSTLVEIFIVWSLFLTTSKKYLCKYKLQRKPIIKQKQRDTHFHMFLTLMLKIHVFI